MASPSPKSARFFVALLPPQPVQDAVTAIKQEIEQRFSSRAALKSPPHITLQPPFNWSLERLDELQHHLHRFAHQQQPIPIVLEGFSAFPPRVIYIDVHQTAALMAVQPALIAHLETHCGLREGYRTGSDHRLAPWPFTPHVTVGFRDLAPAAFHQAWAEFEHRPFSAEFEVPTLTLLRHDGQVWQIFSELPLSASKA
ncbi:MULTISPECIES: 2'-5' RNA ligase family protein [Cyanophyceae]|uniref:2'-5' RNA ligase family protein n=1 Tax=Leptolyngbya subtilissima DQ-A4 TaxID=2933933 RepID=A0ABV0K4V5_9CYAN|nr:2'-5' RNA ligase family protein [Nodosilinea sp. FACHB-141]MBD2113519.1 2'-5' RNA ligase family protein [Nodosilinea sp. FACHB-141]